jgi:hypothetical protein
MSIGHKVPARGAKPKSYRWKRKSDIHECTFFRSGRMLDGKARRLGGALGDIAIRRSSSVRPTQVLAPCSHVVEDVAFLDFGPEGAFRCALPAVPASLRHVYVFDMNTSMPTVFRCP